MTLPLIKSIDFDSICVMIKRDLSINYTKLASELRLDTKTISRWRSGKVPYKALSKIEYKPLFDLIEKSCIDQGKKFSSLLVSWFPDLKNYNDDDTLKSIIKKSLDYHINNNVENPPCDESYEHNNINDSIDFFNSCLDNNKGIDNICMSFHSGWNWIKNKKRNRLLEKIDNLGIKIRIITNHSSAISKIAESMADPQEEKYYIGFDEGIKQWNKCASSLTNLEHRISDYPILRRAYIINYKDGSSEALIRNYIYTFFYSNIDKGNVIFNSMDPLLKVYQQEFNYLWNKALCYPQWIKVFSTQKETLSSNKYIMLYLPHSKFDYNKDNFIISILQISKNNEVKLDVNIADSLTPKLSFKSPEYTYYGSSKMTRNNIFMTLFDKSMTEQVSISIIRPLYEQNRLLGIMTALSPQAQPVAFKFACIDSSIYNKIDFQLLKRILDKNNQNNRIWESNLMILEEQDISLFYSNQIFKKDHQR